MNQNLKIKKKGYASRTANNARSMSLEWLVNYNIGIKDHNIRAMAGYSYQYWQNSGFSANNYDFANDGLGS